MEALRIEKTKSTPEIHFDPVQGFLSISGESFPENSYGFYHPLLMWISEFVSTHDERTTLHIELSYLNTGSTKCMMDLLDLLEELFQKGNAIEINWHCDSENDRAVEAAEEFKEEVTLPFNIILQSEAL